MKHLLAVVIGTLLFAAIAVAENQGSKNSGSNGMLRAVVHVNFGDANRQEHALGNIENILKDVPKAEIDVICHGEGISLVEMKKTQHSEKVQSLMKEGVRFVGCENTMKKKSIEKAELLAGTSTVASGAVEVLRKQQAGYGYFKP